MPGYGVSTWNVAVSTPCRDRPLHRPLEDRGVVLVEAEHEAGVHHDAEVVQAADGLRVVPAQVLPLALRAQALGARASRSPRRGCAGRRPTAALEEAGTQHGVHRARGLPEPAHPPHPVEERPGEGGVAEEVVVEEVEVPPGQPLDLRERVLDRLHVEGAPSREEGVLVAEGAGVRAAARDHDRVGDEVELAPDEVAAHARQAGRGCAPPSGRRRRGRPARRSARRRGQVSSAGPRTIESAWRAASSGQDVTWSPPSTTCAPRAR